MEIVAQPETGYYLKPAAGCRVSSHSTECSTRPSLRLAAVALAGAAAALPLTDSVRPHLTGARALPGASGLRTRKRRLGGSLGATKY